MRAAVGIDLGGTKTAAGVVERSGRVLARASVPSDIGSPDRLLDAIRALVESLDAPADMPLGVGAAGVVDYERGRYLFGPNTGLRDVDLPSLVSEALGRPVRMDNDANCATWAEHRFGVGRGSRHFLCVTLGTGIGGGIVVDGRPYRGAHGGAAEIGHMLVEPDGRVCGCGRRGCWEQYASGRALERLGAEEVGAHPDSLVHARAGGDPGAVRGPELTAAARAGDEFARSVVERVAVWIGWGLASLVNILEPDRIAISGGLSEDWDLFAAAAERGMRERVEAPERRPLPRIEKAALGSSAGIVGAAALCFPPD